MDFLNCVVPIACLSAATVSDLDPDSNKILSVKR